MSFILDALKKSEAERQRQNAPGLASIPESERRNSGSKWIWIISALLIVNLAVLVGIMLRPAADSEPAAVEEPVAQQPVTQAAANRPAPAVAVSARQPEPQASPEPSAATNLREPGGAPGPTAAETRTQRVTAGLPSLNELQAQGVLQLPEMHLDIHVYSGQPADRFVFVNMKKYTEGATLSEGPAVREITRDGVVLDYLGTRFLLPRE
jgi:general secretion pathway protein B